MHNKQTTPYKLIPIALFFLGFLEFGASAFLILKIDPDPKNAILFGYSLFRLALFSLASTSALWLLALALLASYRNRVLQKLESMFHNQPLIGGLGLLSLTLLAIVVLILPVELLGKYGFYFERSRQLLFFLCIFPAQLSLNWIKSDWHFNWTFLRLAFVSLGILLVLGGFILFSGLGITPEKDHWDVAGNPITGFQMSVILLVAIIIFAVIGLLMPRFFTLNGKYLDLLIIFALFTSAVLLWNETPVPHNEFSTRPLAPYFQSFPYSDARIHDLGALAVLKGEGILFKTYTDKPLYMVFLAILHIFAGYDYNLLSMLQACFLAFMLPFLYILGKIFHSRLFGLVLATIILVRQQNGILLSNILIYNATPSLLLTEVPTLFGLIVSTFALFYWMREPEDRSWHAFVAGGILGAVSLIRLNPFLLIPAVPVFLFLSLHQSKKEWFRQSMYFILGCAILIVPWVITGKDQSGRSFFILKFQDVINVRYGTSGVLPPEKNATYALEAPLKSLSKPLSASLLLPVNAGRPFPSLDINSFPGFVINHTLHNFVGSFLTLPDSLWPDDQKLAVLMERPYWKLGVEHLALTQIPFILLNLCLLAIGLAWSWKSWKWAGLSPLFVFVGYSLSLGFGRTSGSRYLVPMDWIVDFYFALGLLCLFNLLPKHLRHTLEAEPESELESQPHDKKPSWMVFSTMALIFFVAALIPVAQKLVPSQKALCQSVNLNELKIAPLLADVKPINYLTYGEILYPEITKDRLSFSLLTCQRELSFEITGFPGKLDIGQRVIVGLSDESVYPRLELIVLPPSTANPGKILWQAESK